MNLSLAILKDELPYRARLLGETGMTLSRYAFMLGGGELRENTLYLTADAQAAGGLELPPGSAVLCLGEPSGLAALPAPVLVIEEPAGLADIANCVGDVFHRYHSLETELDRALRGGRMQELVEIMTPFVGNELVVADSNHMILAHSYGEVRSLDISGLSLAENNMMPLEAINFFKNNKRWIEVKTYTEPFIYDEGIFKIRLLCMNIISDGDFCCRVMICETDRPFRSYDRELLRFFSSYVGWLFMNTLSGRTVYAASGLADVLRVLLSGVSVEPQRLRHALEGRGFHEGTGLQCVCIRPSDGDYSSNTVSYYCERIGELFRGIVAFEFKGDIVCLVNVDCYDGSGEGPARELTPFVRDNNFRAGFSNVFRDTQYISGCHRQAEIALSYGISAVPSKWIHKYNEYAMDYIVNQVSSTVGAGTLCDDKILLLYEYDRENGGSYIETIEAYFRNHMNALQTSRELGIHRATMVYRLARIKELCGITFDSARDNLFYQFSIKLLKSAGGAIRAD